MNPTNRILLPARRLLQNQFQRMLTSKIATAPEYNEKSTEAEKNILVKRNGPITLFGINRIKTKNSLDSAAANELSEALDAFEDDEECEIGIIHGIGGNFCSGYDLEEIAKNEINTDNLPHFGLLSSRHVLTKKPLIASISGYAVGVGFELALMCDLRVVEEPARMGFLNRRLGIPIMCGGTVRLPAMVGYSRAMYMILTGKEISSEEAFNLGIANIIVACGAGLGQSVSLARSIIKFPRGPLLADRASTHYATFGAKSMEESLEFEKDNSTDILLDEGIKGAKRFVEGFGRHGKSTNITQSDRTSFRELNDDML